MSFPKSKATGKELRQVTVTPGADRGWGVYDSVKEFGVDQAGLKLSLYAALLASDLLCSPGWCPLAIGWALQSL